MPRVYTDTHTDDTKLIRCRTIHAVGLTLVTSLATFTSLYVAENDGAWGVSGADNEPLVQGMPSKDAAVKVAAAWLLKHGAAS